MSPIISIVIANYNYGRFLEEAISSIVTQSSSNDVEIIVCDAGSTDNSVEIIRKYANRIAWWVSEKDKGQSDAFNKGFSHAKGIYGCWLNADDIFLPGALRKVILYLKENQATDWLTGGTVFFKSDRSVFGMSRLYGNGLDRLLPVPAWMKVGAPSSFFRLEKLKELGGFDINLHYVMDVDLWMNLGSNNVKLTHLGSYVWGFRVHESSKTSALVTANVKNDAFRKESLLVRERYGFLRTKERIFVFVNRIYGLLSLAFLRRFLALRRAKRFGLRIFGE